MDFVRPFVRQLMVASAPQLAALSVGGSNGYPAVLINQLKSNDSLIKLDIDTTSWIASINGLAGIPSIAIPCLMQWRGRKIAFIASCLSILLGWTVVFFANNVTSILIGQCFHGFGGRSLNAVSLITISEMVDTKYRSTSMVLFGIIEMMGLVVVTVAGYFLDWRTVSVVLAAPCLIALLMAVIWPESPSWLACKGKFRKCETAFILLRGTGNEATKELTELIRAQKESLQEVELQESLHSSSIRGLWSKICRRDFFVPIFYVILTMFTFYFSGPLVVFTYAVQIVANTTRSSDFICFVYIDVIIIVGSITGVVLLKRFNNKAILFASLFGSGVFLILSSIMIYCKDFDGMPQHGLLLCVLGNLFCCTFGSCYLTFNISAELIPVKHRGLGGGVYVIIACLLHSSVLKISPYLFEGIDVSGTFIIYAVVSLVGATAIWCLVPETKGKTLQEIEDFYNKTL